MGRGIHGQPPGTTAGRTLRIVLGVSLVALTITVFWPVQRQGFLTYDDDHYVTENAQLQKGLTSENVVWAFTTGTFANWHPMTWLSYLLDYQLGGMNPKGYHLTNLWLHAVGVLLLFLVLARMTQCVWASAWVAAVFAIHPLHVESVAWVAERKDVLSGVFFMATLWAYVRYAERPGRGRYLLVALLFALGLMSKPMLVSLPCVLLLLDYWPLGRLQGASAALRASETSALPFVRAGAAQLVREKAPLFGMAVASSVITVIAQRHGGAVTEAEALALSIRLGNAVVSYVGYLGHMFWPVGLALHYPHKGPELPGWQIVGAVVVLAAVTVVVVRSARARSYLPVGWLWYLGMLIPVIGVVQVGSQAMADRYMHLPIIGPAMMLAWGVPALMSRLRHRKAGLAALGSMAVVAMAVGARLQVNLWKNPETLYRHTIAVTERNARVMGLLGNVLYKQGRLEEAVELYRQTVSILPDSASDWNNLGNVLQDLGQLPEAEERFNKAIVLDANYATPHYNLGNLFMQKGKIETAINEYREAVRLDPSYAEAQANLGVALYSRGLYAESLKHLTEALRLLPGSYRVHKHLGKTLARLGRNEEARHHLKEAVRLNPEDRESRGELLRLL